MRLFNFTTASGATYEISISYGIAKTRLLSALTRLGGCLTKSWRWLMNIPTKRPSASLNACGNVAVASGTPAGSVLVTVYGHAAGGGHAGAGGSGGAAGGGGGGAGGVVWRAPNPPEPDVKCDACGGTGTFYNEECWHCFGEGLDPTK